mmetsp:Transcript_44003/g.91851  ORF Transcript_44003/g.91851 Transcript_44003/m.91851 type:complete len:266 (+) Transcript_44003:166-963(+)
MKQSRLVHRRKTCRDLEQGLSESCACKAFVVSVGLHPGLLGRRHVATLPVRKACDKAIAVDTRHCLSQILRDLGHHLRIVVVRDGLHDGPGTLGGIGRLEDATTHEHAIDPKLHAQGSICWSGNPTGREVHNWQLSCLLDLLQEVDGSANLLGVGEELVVIHHLHHSHLLVQRSDVPHGLDDIAGAGLALRADHAGSLGDAAQGLAKVAAAAHERNLELGLVDVVALICDGQDFALIDAVNTDLLQDLRLHKVANPALGHHRDGH